MGPGVGLVYDERMCEHANLEDPGHPEKPERISAIFELLQSSGIVEKCERVESREVTDEELAWVHTPDHIAAMRAVGKQAYGKEERIALRKRYNSIFFNKGSTRAALLAAGSVVEVARKVAIGELAAGAAVVRPPGHHAEADAAMGFCLFNNVAIAAHAVAHGLPSLGEKKVLIVDWDVHHGNGTQHMFWEDPKVLYFSIHRYDESSFYPHSEDGNSDKVGGGAGQGFNVNVPWPRRGYGDQDYLEVFDHVLMPIAHEFEPDLVLISGGFDSAKGDPLGACQVTPAGFYHMTRRLMGLAGGRVVLALEGGYNLKSIANSYLACMKALLREPFDENVSAENNLLASTWSLIKEVRMHHQRFWSSMLKEDADLDRVPEYFVVHDDIALISSSSDEEEESEDDVFEDLAESFNDLQVEEISGDLFSIDDSSATDESRSDLVVDLINHCHLSSYSPRGKEQTIPIVYEPVPEPVEGVKIEASMPPVFQDPVPVVVELVKPDVDTDGRE